MAALLFGYEEWFLTLMEEMKVKVLEYSVLREIFGTKMNANVERRIYNEELHSFTNYFLLSEWFRLEY